MDKISCEIIKDLLPLYIDDVVSEDSKALVEHHLNDCDECRREAEKMKSNIAVPASKKAAAAVKNTLARAKKSARLKKIAIAVISVIVSGAVIFGAFVASVSIKIPIEYDASEMTVTTDNEYIYVNYEGAYTYTSGYLLEDVSVDGEKKDILVLESYVSIWSKYIEPIFENNKTPYIYVTGIDDCEVIYYGDIRSDTDDENKYTSGGIVDYLDDYNIIWEK